MIVVYALNQAAVGVLLCILYLAGRQEHGSFGRSVCALNMLVFIFDLRGKIPRGFVVDVML